MVSKERIQTHLELNGSCRLNRWLHWDLQIKFALRLHNKLDTLALGALETLLDLELEGFGWIVWPLNLHLLILLQLVNEVLQVLSGILLLGCLELGVILAK